MQLKPLTCDTIAYRAVTRKKDVNWSDRIVLANAFLRRDSDSDGLSVSYNCEPIACGADLEYIYAAASLHVGRIRQMDLDVVPDSVHHANIKELAYSSKNRALAERQAELIARSARLALDEGGMKIPSRKNPRST